MSLQSSFITTALIGSLVFIGGCSTFDSTWKSTKAFYGEYINPPAQIDYDDKGVLNDAETTLASRMVGIDIQLEQLLKRARALQQEVAAADDSDTE